MKSLEKETPSPGFDIEITSIIATQDRSGHYFPPALFHFMHHSRSNHVVLGLLMFLLSNFL